MKPKVTLRNAGEGPEEGSGEFGRTEGRLQDSLVLAFQKSRAARDLCAQLVTGEMEECFLFV